MMRNKSSQSRTGAVLLALLIVCGCGKAVPVAPVSGTITYQGKPLVGASITTQPTASKGSLNPGPGSWGKTDAEGRYQLEVVQPAIEGAIVGRHRVTIIRSQKSANYKDPWSDDAFVPADRTWPERFTNGSLTLEVPAGGRQDADFDLTAK